MAYMKVNSLQPGPAVDTYTLVNKVDTGSESESENQKLFILYIYIWNTSSNISFKHTHTQKCRLFENMLVKRPINVVHSI